MANPFATMDMISPCKGGCGAQVPVKVTNAVDLAAFVTMGVLCESCKERQDLARDMTE